MAHGIGAAAAGSVTTDLFAWASFGASLVAIAGFGVTVRRRRKGKPPKPPQYPASQHDWDEYSIRVDQFFKDQGGSD